MNKKRKSAKKPARRKTAKKSTALARRSDVAKFEIDDPNGLLSPNSPEGFELGELATTGGVGLGQIKLSKRELKLIAKPVSQADVMLLPSGIAYLPHLYYTRWLNEMFGPTGWGIAPASRPSKVDNVNDSGKVTGALIMVPHILYIRGVAVAWATGAAQYWVSNKQQTYDDVLESTTAYALRRLCKRLGMALELWDKRWQHAFLAKEGIQVRVKTRTSIETQWRRRNDPPIAGELTAGRGEESERKVHTPEVVDAEPVGDDGNGKERISKDQVKRLVGLWRNAGRNDADVRLWLGKVYGYQATAEIKRFDYQKIERAIMARGDLRIPGDE